MQNIPARTFARGQMVFSVDDPGSFFFIIKSGRVEISLLSHSGKRTVLNHMGPGEVFGEIAILDGDHRTAHATAAKLSSLGVVDRPSTNQSLENRDALAIAMIDILCGHLIPIRMKFDSSGKRRVGNLPTIP